MQNAIIIGGPVSPYVRKVMAVCDLKGVAWCVDPIIPFQGNDAFTRISPLRSVPVFIDDAVTFLQWMMGKEPAQMVVDTITLTTTEGVVPSDNRVMKEMIEASRSNDVRVFYELPETGGVFGAIQQNAAALFLGEMSPEDFSQVLQDAVQPSGM